MRLDYADVAAWREWLPLPGQIATGTGALRRLGRLRPPGTERDRRRRRARRCQGDAREPNLPEIELAHLSGRVGTRKTGAQRELFTQALAFTTRDGERLDPTNFTLTWREGRDERVESGRIEFDRMQLGPLVALSAHLPLPDRIRADLARFAPRGTLTQGRLRWAGTVDGADELRGERRLHAVWGFWRRTRFPGSTGLNGRVEATMDGGEIRLAGNNVTLDLPRVLEAPIAFDSLQSLVKWERRDGATKVKVEQLEIANADVSGGRIGNLPHAAERARGDRNRRACVARRRAADPSLSAAGDRRDDAALAGDGARRRHRGRRAAQDFRQPGRFPVRPRQGRQAHVHDEGEGRHARPHARAGRRSKPSTPTCASTARGSPSTRRAGACTASTSARRMSRSPIWPRIPRCYASTAKRRDPSPSFMRYVNESPARGAHRSDHRAMPRCVGRRAARAQDRSFRSGIPRT